MSERQRQSELSAKARGIRAESSHVQCSLRAHLALGELTLGNVQRVGSVGNYSKQNESPVSC